MPTFDTETEYAQHDPADDAAASRSKLNVYFAADDNGDRRIVAVHSARGAAKLLGLSLHFFRVRGGSTTRDIEIDVALSDPGAVFKLAAGTRRWVRIQSSAAATRLPTPGGARAGAGRRTLYDERLANRTIQATDEQWAAILELGGSDWIRRTAEKAIKAKRKRETAKGTS